MRVSRQSTRAAATRRRSLQTHVVLDRVDAFDLARHGNRRVLSGRRAHKPAQLNHALERLDVEFGGLERRAAMTNTPAIVANLRVIFVMPFPSK
jgi:hypothetical protein